MSMTVYELLIDRNIKKIGLQKHLENENLYVIQASLISGMMAALTTNALEVVVVRK